MSCTKLTHVPISAAQNAVFKTAAAVAEEGRRLQGGGGAVDAGACLVMADSVSGAFAGGEWPYSSI